MRKPLDSKTGNRSPNELEQDFKKFETVVEMLTLLRLVKKTVKQQTNK